MYYAYQYRGAGIINLAMNAGKFVSATSHQHNASLHFYLHPSSPSTSSSSLSLSPSSSTIISSSQQQSASSTIPSEDTIPIYSTNAKEDFNEEVLNCTLDAMKQKVTGSTDMNSSQLLSNSKGSLRKVDTGGSKQNLKRKRTDIQAYFTSSGKSRLLLLYSTYIHVT